LFAAIVIETDDLGIVQGGPEDGPAEILSLDMLMVEFGTLLTYSMFSVRNLGADVVVVVVVVVVLVVVVVVAVGPLYLRITFIGTV
jgi:hypothetical protein